MSDLDKALKLLANLVYQQEAFIWGYYDIPQHCSYCNGGTDGTMTITHEEDCPVVVARRFLEDHNVRPRPTPTHMDDLPF